jgi:hypothetical protein
MKPYFTRSGLQEQMARAGLKQGCNPGAGEYIGVASVLVCCFNTPASERQSHETLVFLPYDRVAMGFLELGTGQRR